MSMKPFHFLCVPPSIFFISVLQFLLYRSFTSWAKLIPEYFILFDAIVNEIVLKGILKCNISIQKYGVCLFSKCIE